MAVSLSSPASVVNAALARIGYKEFVGNLHDGSAAAEVALQVFGQARDDLLRSGDWAFAQREIALTLLKFAPTAYIPGVTPWDPATNPPLSYKFEYDYPANCLSVRPPPIFVPSYDPRPVSFRISNDNYYTPAKRVILTNIADAICTFTGRVIDPTTWPPDFAEILVETLGKLLAPALASVDMAKLEAAESRADKGAAMMEQG
jgi:hypothetical protein